MNTASYFKISNAHLRITPTSRGYALSLFQLSEHGSHFPLGVFETLDMALNHAFEQHSTIPVILFNDGKMKLGAKAAGAATSAGGGAAPAAYAARFDPHG